MRRLIALARSRPIILPAFLAGLLLLSGCGPASPTPAAEVAEKLVAEEETVAPSTSDDEELPAEEEPAETTAASVEEIPSPEATEIATNAPSELSDEVVAELLADLLDAGGLSVGALLDTILESGDQRFVSVLGRRAPTPGPTLPKGE